MTSSSIHVAGIDQNSFCMVKYYSAVCRFHVLIVHLQIDGHLMLFPSLVYPNYSEHGCACLPWISMALHTSVLLVLPSLPPIVVPSLSPMPTHTSHFIWEFSFFRHAHLPRCPRISLASLIKYGGGLLFPCVRLLFRNCAWQRGHVQCTLTKSCMKTRTDWWPQLLSLATDTVVTSC